MWKSLFLNSSLSSKEMEQCSHIYKCVHRSSSGGFASKEVCWICWDLFLSEGTVFWSKLAVSIMCCVQDSALHEVEFQLLLNTQWFTCAWFYPGYLHSFPTDPNLPGSPFILLSSFLPLDLVDKFGWECGNLVLGVHWGCGAPQQDAVHIMSPPFS